MECLDNDYELQLQRSSENYENEKTNLRYGFI